MYFTKPSNGAGANQSKIFSLDHNSMLFGQLDVNLIIL